MASYHFKAHIVERTTEGQVSFSLSDEDQCIEIASDWLEHFESASDARDSSRSGYLGHGFTKVGVYVRIAL